VDNRSAGQSMPRHSALLYSEPANFSAAAAEFAAGADSAGAPLFVAATGDNLAAFAPFAEGNGRHVRLADLSGQNANPGRIFGLIRNFVQEHPGRPVRCWQDVGWPGRSADGLTEAIKYEALFGRAFAGLPVTVLCSYDTRLGEGALADAERLHSSVLRGGRWRPRTHAGDQAAARPDPPLGSPPAGAATLTFRDDQAGVRGFAAARARAAGLSPGRIADLTIAVGELAGNTLVHTSGQGTLAIWVAGDELIFQVSDTGCIKDPLAGTLRPEPAAGSRRGLWLVHQIGDLVQTRTGPSGTTTRVLMRLPA
jgi:anti-sigma regulatory factor (Ser/Thr protein kinase)